MALETIAARARAEGDRVEAEERGEQPPPAEGERGEQPPPAEGDAEQQAEPQGRRKASRKAAARSAEAEAADAHLARLTAAMASFEAELRDLFELAEPLEEAPIEGVIGFALPGAFDQRAHESFTRCEVCNGHGLVLTGSLRPGNETAECPDRRCAGRGYWARESVQPARTVETSSHGPLAVPVNGAGDAWADAPAWMGDPTVRPPAAQ